MEILIRSRGNTLVVLLLCCLLSACGGGGSSSSANTNTIETLSSPLLGVWQSTSCTYTSLFRFSFDTLYTFRSDGSVTVSVSNYADVNCRVLAFTEILEGRFGDGGEQILPDGTIARNLDLSADGSRTITPVTTEGVELLLTAEACGINDWQLGVSRTAEVCPIGERVIIGLNSPDTFDIYSLVDDHFLFSGTETAFTSGTRPTELMVFPTLARVPEPSAGFPPESLGFWQASGTAFFLEFRENSVLHILSIIPEEGDCWGLDRFAMLDDGQGNYSSPLSIVGSFSLSMSGDQLVLSNPDTDLLLDRLGFEFPAGVELCVAR